LETSKRSEKAETNKNFIEMSVIRKIAQIVYSQNQNDGMGAKVRRSIGTMKLRNFDPFLMLDYFMVQSPAGFPDHPHRGFSTVTYMIDGSFAHEDFDGHRGLIKAGDVQWMTAGRGIVHAEMPATNELNTGLQLWINLPKKWKMIEPDYQELTSDQIPKLEPQEGVKIVAIAGIEGAKIYTKTPIMYLDIQIQPNTTFEQSIPKNYNLFAYILEGQGSFDSSSQEIQAHNCVTFNHETTQSTLQIKTTSSAFRFALIGGEPLNETVVQHGPFVMNTKEEVQEAMQDYYSFRNGFEKAKGFQSEIGNVNK
jgi:redox-sensitive bicupin YhaK (pirin superfamily)